jgi:hypothetical protein
LAGVLKGRHGDSELLAPREPFLDLDISRVRRVNVLCLLRFVLGFPARVPLPSIPILREECLHTDGITDRVRIIITWAHLYEDKRVCLDGFEELTEYIINECYKIFVRLFLGK